MTIQSGRTSRSRVAWRLVGVAFALGLGALAGETIEDRRGPVLGILAFLLYGVLMAAVMWSPAAMRRWSARHPVLDRLIFVPLACFGLLLIPALPWWGAALLAVVAGAAFVTFATRRDNPRNRRDKRRAAKG